MFNYFNFFFGKISNEHLRLLKVFNSCHSFFERFKLFIHFYLIPLSSFLSLSKSLTSFSAGFHPTPYPTLGLSNKPLHNSKNSFISCLSFFPKISVLMPLLTSLFIMCVCSVTQSCLTLWDPRDSSPPGPSVHGIFQATTLEWDAMSFSRGSSHPGIEIVSPALSGWFFVIEVRTGEAFYKLYCFKFYVCEYQL